MKKRYQLNALQPLSKVVIILLMFIGKEGKQVGDCQDEQVLAALGVANFDACFACVRDDFQSFLEATATL